jgi:CRP-like cAMP-binding protein
MSEAADSFAEELVALAGAHGVARELLEPSLPLWRARAVEPGAALARGGKRATAATLVLEGELVIRAGRHEIGRLRAGDFAGLSTCIIKNGTWPASLVGGRRARVAELADSALFGLRKAHDPLYAALLELELNGLLQRVQQVDDKIASLRAGTFPPMSRQPQSIFTRLWRTLRPQASEGCPPLEPLLRELPGLRAAPAELVSTLAAAFRPRMAREKEVVALEGEAGGSLLLIAGGQCDVLRNTADGSASLMLARLDRGALFDVAALMRRGPRDKSLVATSDAALYEMPAQAFDELAAQPRRALLESLAVMVHRQVRAAIRSLVAAIEVFESHTIENPGQLSEQSLVLMMTAQGQLAGGRARKDPEGE